MSCLRSRIVLLFVCLGLVSGCSDSEQPEEVAAPMISVFATEGDGEGRDAAGPRREAGDEAVDPVVEELSVEPGVLASRERVRAVARVSGSWTSLEYEWALNGKVFGGNAREVVLPMLATGDSVSVRVTPIRGVREGGAKSVSLRVQNQGPMLLGLGIERVRADDGDVPAGTEMWRAVVRAEDPDGDSVEIEYRWLVNGVASDVDGDLFPVERLARGDRLEVEVRASDGRVWSPLVRSGEVEVGNTPPKIVSTPPRPDALGKFRYQVRAEDPDGDLDLRFGLREAPEGMRIDEINGIVTWTPTEDQAGRHQIEIVVTDGGGAESSQVFSFALVTRIDDEGPGPAAAR